MQIIRRRYSPRRVPDWTVPALAVAFGILTVVRGIGWMTGTRETTIATVVMDALLNPFWWGLGLVAGGSALVAAYASRRHFLIWLAHGHLLAMYTCIAITVIQSTFAFGGGWQHITAPLGGALWHGFCTWLTGPSPSRGVADAD